MTVRNSFAGLPPFLFGDGGLHNQLVCDVRTYVRANDGSRDLLAPMLAWSPGPPAIGDTGDNSPGHMMGTTWLLQVCPDGSWVLYREERGRLEVVPFDDPPDPVSPTARHVSLCFDQSARVVLAWEDQGIIKVRRWDPTLNEYIENVSFSGVDPVVVFDAQWALDIPQSDVLLFYLSPDRTRVLCRVQRDVYAVEHEIWERSGHWEGDPDPQTESQVTSTTTGSAYPSYYSEATIHEDGRLTHVRIDASSAGAWSLSVEPAGGGPALAGASASGGPGVIEFTLPDPLPVSAATAYRFVFTPPTSAQVRYNTAAWSGALWSASTLFFVGFGIFNGSPPMGLTVDVGEAVFVPGGPVILDRVIATPLRYQVLVSDATGTPLPEMLLSDLYPYLAFDSLTAVAAGPSAGEYELVVLTDDLAEGISVTATGPSGGAYADPVINYELTGDALEAQATGPSGGAYAEAIISYQLAEELDAVAEGPASGDYVLAVIETSLTDEGIAVTATGPTGGNYDPA